MKHWLASLILLPLLLFQGTPPVVYAAPYGAGGECSTDAPCSLSVALALGGSIWLLPGTYVGDLTISTANTILRSVPGTRARIDGGVTIIGAGATLRDLEITDTSWLTRTTATSAQVARGVTVQAQNVTLDSLWIHDLANGIGAFNGSAGASAGLIARNCLLYNIGYGSGLGTGHGHAIYTQNDSAGEKRFEENTIANGYGFAIQAYGSSGPSAQLEKMTFQGNVAVNNRFLVGGGNPLKQIVIADNRGWMSPFQVGYGSTINQDVSIAGNWLGMGRLQVQKVMTPTVSLNHIVAPASDNPIYMIPPLGAGVWNTNTYYRPTPNNTNPFAIDGVGFYSLAQWRTVTGWDVTSIFTATLPVQNWTDVTASTPHHGRVVVFNWTNAPTVTLDLVPLALTSGASYRLINAQNPAEAQLFVAGTPVSLPAGGWTVQAPIGAAQPLSAWDSRFLVFLVEPA